MLFRIRSGHAATRGFGTWWSDLRRIYTNHHHVIRRTYQTDIGSINLHQQSKRYVTSSISKQQEPGTHTSTAGATTLAPRRFYKQVTVFKLPHTEHSHANDAYGVMLDLRKLRTPQKQIFRVPSRDLALAVAAEWAAQFGRILRSSMPLMALCSAAVDLERNPQLRQQMIRSLMNFIHTDSTRYRVAYPESLYNEQERLLTPLLKYFEHKWDISLPSTESLFATKVPESDPSFQAIQKALIAMDNFSLVAMDLCCSSSKSLVIAFALYDNFIQAQHAIQAARVEEDFQMRVYGKVEGGHDIDIADIKKRTASASCMFRFRDLDQDAFQNFFPRQD